MHAFTALEFNGDVFGPTMALGVAAAGLYGILAVSLVLTYRVSRTIGFVQGGIALLSTNFYWWLTTDTQGGPAFAGAALGGETRMGRWAGMITVVFLGGVMGLLYGLTVTSKRLSQQPRLTLTVYSLAWLLLLAGIAISKFVQDFFRVPSLFGTKTYNFFGGYVSTHQLVTLVFLVALILILGFVLLRTQTGINIRAIADDVEASRFVGIPLSRVAIGVYAVAGILSGFAGVLLASTAGTGIVPVILVFLRALTMSVLGGFTSFGLALAGCLILGVGESTLNGGLWGPMSGGETEMIIMTVLFASVLLINRLRPTKILEAQAL